MKKKSYLALSLVYWLWLVLKGYFVNKKVDFYCLDKTNACGNIPSRTEPKYVNRNRQLQILKKPVSLRVTFKRNN